MEFIFTFLEGIASFISPCLLPMLPIYISYFIGKDNKNVKKAVLNASGFVLGFTIVFLVLSIFASQLGSLISSYIKYIKIFFGVIVILLGLNYMEIIDLKFLNKIKMKQADTKDLTFLKSILFGSVFSISWTPCIGTFLSSALLLIAKEQDIIKGILLMLVYSIGLGIPFIISAVLLEKLKEMFNVIKRNYDKIKKISGLILILMGIYMIFF
ncbi:MAG TPA: sulfite exporter TauE/SafE family protein [Candidatus Merdicola faecigallinarum]|uniref:Sulfite exporter TauE/SafE family protein n=1 Tax=Candidatus Merdicola faecigallinarum TaxID=2840862 RepID=A0A9D1M1U1_9FIRM|nr:sulfite exporter TauE/SafE family protein [Candidatus Merdicola faecigallinarum]